MNISKRAGPHLRQTANGLVLLGSRLGDQPAQFPPADHLFDGAQPTEVPLGPTGRLYSRTVVHPGKDKAPYALAMVDFGPVRAFGGLLFAGSPPALDSEVRVVPFTLPDGEADYAFAEVAS